jgi:hypothetical protein
MIESNFVREKDDYINNNNEEVANLIADSPDVKRENTRSKIATIYVYAFFLTIVFTFVIGLIKCFNVKDYIDFLIAVSGVLSGPLGFIIGYYFKASDNK